MAIIRVPKLEHNKVEFLENFILISDKDFLYDRKLNIIATNPDGMLALVDITSENITKNLKFTKDQEELRAIVYDEAFVGGMSPDENILTAINVLNSNESKDEKIRLLERLGYKFRD